MKRFVLALLLFIPCLLNAMPIEEINIRDPFIVADETTHTYYLYCSSSVKGSQGQSIGGVAAYKSKDLKNWEGPIQVFTVPEDNWITGNVWAPEVHKYNGKYYLFATLNTDIEWRHAKGNGWPKYYYRGTQVFYADSPEGPFQAFDKVPHTPMAWMCLDGTLFVEDNGQPYMVFCHEWVQTVDGTMCAVPLATDLSMPVGNPQTLFYASAAAWSTGSEIKGSDERSYVTDGCFLYRTSKGKLLMIWSSFMNGQYAIGIAESTSDHVQGPWRQHQEPLFNKDGGHAMIFKSFEGKLFIVFHSPNSPSGAERARLYEIEDMGDSLKLIIDN